MSDRGQRLVEAMQRRNITKQTALAVALGVNDSTVTRWKKDGSISVDSVLLLCRALDISLDWFLNGTGAIDAPKALQGFAEAPTDQSIYRAETSLDLLSQTRLAEFLETVMSKPR